MMFEPSRRAGLATARSFVDERVERYARLRNFDFGPEHRDNVSMLSPYVRHRLVLEHELIGMTLRRHSPGNVKKFIDEVFWRGYFKGWLQHHPDVWTDYREDLGELLDELQADAARLDEYTTATEGNTGIDCFDAWVKELVETGYLHNHARMWFASIWVFTLNLPWQLGADFFLRHLVDGDAASNTLSWRWVSGLHTKGKTYLARVSNIANYTDGRFEPQGLATSAPPLDDDRKYETIELNLAGTELPDEPYGLLVTEDDCCAETLHPGLRPAALAGAVAIRQRSPLPVGTQAHTFATGAVTDALQRASDHFSDVPTSYFEEDEWTEKLAEWATCHHLTTIVTASPPEGPVADVYRRTAQELSRYGIRTWEISRAYDRAAWPHAKRGFFRLKKKIPSIIEALDLDEFDKDGGFDEYQAGSRAAMSSSG